MEEYQCARKAWDEGKKGEYTGVPVYVFELNELELLLVFEGASRLYSKQSQWPVVNWMIMSRFNGKQSLSFADDDRGTWIKLWQIIEEEESCVLDTQMPHNSWWKITWQDDTMYLRISDDIGHSYLARLTRGDAHALGRFIKRMTEILR